MIRFSLIIITLNNQNHIIIWSLGFTVILTMTRPLRRAVWSIPASCTGSELGPGLLRGEDEVTQTDRSVSLKPNH